jgi:Flp pilus assembly protein TadG
MTSSLVCKLPRKMVGERGQAILELLPVIVVLLTLTFAVIDFSRAIWQVQVLTGLTREGSNLASRNTTLADSATAIINDGAALNLASNGYVIITSVQNVSGTLVITGQYSTGSISAASKIGTYDPLVPAPATLPATTPVVPQPGDTIYVTEIFSKFSPITPLGAFVNFAVPSTLYDVAYF